MDTIKKVANAILDAGEGCQSGLFYVDPVEAAKAAIAALETDAEPVAWQAQGDDGIWRYVEMPRTAKSMGMPVRPVYAAPPTPSVAVKALEELDRLAEAGLCASSFSGARAFHEDIRAKVKSALSSQVQDVAIPEGWQLVPKEPTKEMKRADAGTSTTDAMSWNAALYRAILAAAPVSKLEEKP